MNQSGVITISSVKTRPTTLNIRSKTLTVNLPPLVGRNRGSVLDLCCIRHSSAEHKREVGHCVDASNSGEGYLSTLWRNASGERLNKVRPSTYG